jgi:anti-sigma B factor antagonist
MDLSISARRLNSDEACGVVTVSGEIDIATYRELRSALDDLHRCGLYRIVLDLSAVGYCDSTGIGVLATYAKRLLDDGGSLRLAGVRPAVAEIFGIAGLTAVVPAFPTVALALANRPDAAPAR